MNGRPVRCALALAATITCLQALPTAEARGQVSLIRDAEIEHITRKWAAPLFAAAGLDPSAVEIHIVSDPRLNAFVGGGQRVFLNTGLILAATDPLQILGVVAHETSHLAGGHIARTQEALRAASAQAVVAFLVGAAAMAGGQGGAGAALFLGGQEVAQRTLLRYSRAQESAADQAALSLLDAAGYSARGVVEFLEFLNQQEGLLESRQDPYLRSHPLFPERISAVSAAAAALPHANAPAPPQYVEDLARMQAKLFGFLETQTRIARRYPASDQSLPARYARAVALHRSGRVNDAVAEIDALLGGAPDDPFFHELRGQILLESGRVAQAMPSYARSVELAPNEPLLRVGLASTQIAMSDPELLPTAVQHLQTALQREPRNAEAWRLLAVAFGRGGEIGQSALASAEQNMLSGPDADALRFAEQALRILPTGSPGWLRAQDIKTTVENRRNAARR